MSAGHGHRLHHPGRSLVHRAQAHHKVLVLLGFVLLVVATPADRYDLFALEAAALAGVVATSGVPVSSLARRTVVEVPFLVFALVLPFVATGPRTEVLGITVSEPGLVAAGGLAVKGTLGVLASLTLAATTEPHDLLRGLERLRLPRLLVQILAFMIRYLEVVGAEVSRMRVALASRGFRARHPRHWPVIARSIGALFVRSYERGERVHLAMLARGLEPQAPGR